MLLLRMRHWILLYCILVVCFSLSGLTAQEHASGKKQKEAFDLFQKIERGIAGGTIEPFEQDFAATVSLSLSQDRGLFSANQAKAILGAYLAQCPGIKFSFSTVNTDVAVPYATGRMTYIQHGSQSSVQIYLLLVRHEGRWNISQFNIY
jgi:hypothetical protein